jgi:hypothetical protein
MILCRKGYAALKRSEFLLLFFPALADFVAMRARPEDLTYTIRGAAQALRNKNARDDPRPLRRPELLALLARQAKPAAT